MNRLVLWGSYQILMVWTMNINEHYLILFFLIFLLFWPMFPPLLVLLVSSSKDMVTINLFLWWSKQQIVYKTSITICNQHGCNETSCYFVSPKKMSDKSFFIHFQSKKARNVLVCFCFVLFSPWKRQDLFWLIK